MQIIQVPEAKEMVEAYRNGNITLDELQEELELCWDKQICKGAKTPIAERPSLSITAILGRDG
jgi:hypothetical protein